ncbi:hypothetical protein D3C86_1794320 [compost metagenome]
MQKNLFLNQPPDKPRNDHRNPEPALQQEFHLKPQLQLRKQHPDWDMPPSVVLVVYNREALPMNLMVQKAIRRS